MTKSRLATLITVAVLLGTLAFSLRKRPVAASTPQDAVYAMLDAARSGDAKAYLSHYTGRMAENLHQTVSRDYLLASNSMIKGVAVMEPKTLSDREVEVRVEYVYQDRNEAQTLYLEKESDTWKIARVDSAERVKTLIPYGTPVQ